MLEVTGQPIFNASVGVLCMRFEFRHQGLNHLMLHRASSNLSRRRQVYDRKLQGAAALACPVTVGAEAVDDVGTVASDGNVALPAKRDRRPDDVTCFELQLQVRLV